VSHVLGLYNETSPFLSHSKRRSIKDRQNLEIRGDPSDVQGVSKQPPDVNEVIGVLAVKVPV